MLNVGGEENNTIVEEDESDSEDGSVANGSALDGGAAIRPKGIPLNLDGSKQKNVNLSQSKSSRNALFSSYS